MRLLVVMNHFPLPARTGSTIVASETLRRIAGRHHVHLVTRQGGPVSEVLAWGIDRVETLDERPDQNLLAKVGRVGSLARGEPIHVSSARSRATSTKVRSLLAQGGFDAIVLFENSALQFVPRAHWGRVIANIEDPASLKNWRLAGLPHLAPRERARALLESVASHHYERLTLRHLARVLLLSPDDAAAVARQHGLGNVSTMRYGVTPPPRSELPPRNRRIPGLVVISGNMFHPPNVDGVLHFLHDVFPRVLSRRPDARLRLVGADPEPRIVAAAPRFGDRVEITGRVPDVSAHLREAMVSACPIRLRVGVQTKILESMAWGTPVVSTAVANSGVRGEHGVALLATDDPRVFANHVVSVLNGERWEVLSSGGRDLVDSRFSWDQSVSDLLSAVDDVLRSRYRH